MPESVFTDEVESELIPLSALSQYAYCIRRCALIHIEQAWEDNQFTAEGRIMHERVHEESMVSRGNIRIAHDVPLRSLRLGLIGKADVVEFHLQSGGVWRPFPVEHKRGKPKADHSDIIQLCAQALCLEEMLSVPIVEGAIFYGRTRRRLDVVFDEALRKETEETAKNVRTLFRLGQTPPPVYAKRCESCSLIAECLPKTLQKKRSVKHYISRMIAET